MTSCISGTSDQTCASVSSIFLHHHDRCSQENICILLLIGIPGSGKSYFRVFLENYFRANSKTVLGFVKVFSVSYDDFSKVRNPTQFNDGLSWKEERLEILQSVEQIITNLKYNMHDMCNVSLERVHKVNSEIDSPNTILFIIDDNMYYRSMRYEYYKLARSYNLSFCQFFFDAKLQDALKYNKQRESHSQVPDFVIESIFNRMEPPDESISWEKHVLVLSPYIDFVRDVVVDRIFSVIETALKWPVQRISDSNCKEESQQINNSNAIHKIDNALKKLVGELIKRRVREGSVNSRKISQQYSEKRLGTLKAIKERKIILPVDLNGPISEMDIELIIPKLSAFLD